VAAIVSLLLSGGCASPVFMVATTYDYFVKPARDDAWSRKIRGWQERARGSHVPASPDLPAVAESGESGESRRVEGDESARLRAKYDAFRAEQRRTQALELARWIQDQAPDHYVADGVVDHWATLEETFARNVEDCDGLELLAYHMLRELGFSDQEVFRSIVVRPSDGQHHMVTLWFEDPQDPWVIDPTGAMTTGMPRMSDVPSWVPLKVFTEHRDYTVHAGITTARR